MEISLGIPTDFRSRTFNPGGSGRVSFTREHYGNKAGIIGVGAVNYYTDQEYSYFEVTPEIDIGIGIIVSPRIFVNIMVNQEKFSTSTDFYIEYLLGRKSSLEAFMGKGLINTNKMFYSGISFNWIGWRKK
jgi:hypothetical protein